MWIKASDGEWWNSTKLVVMFRSTSVSWCGDGKKHLIKAHIRAVDDEPIVLCEVGSEQVRNLIWRDLESAMKKKCNTFSVIQAEDDAEVSIEAARMYNEAAKPMTLEEMEEAVEAESN